MALAALISLVSVFFVVLALVAVEAAAALVAMVRMCMGAEMVNADRKAVRLISEFMVEAACGFVGWMERKNLDFAFFFAKQIELRDLTL